jgi:hypothetical protein
MEESNSADTAANARSLKRFVRMDDMIVDYRMQVPQTVVPRTVGVQVECSLLACIGSTVRC